MCDAVWELFRLAWQRIGGTSTLLEWDGDVPPFEQVHDEVLRARSFMEGAFDRSRLADSAPGQEASISTPVDFLVPGVMDSTRLETR